MKIYLLLAFFCFCSAAAISQPSPKWQSKLDTNYIQVLAAKWSLRFHTISKYDQFTVSGPGYAASFKPDVKIAFGIGASYKNLAIDLGLNLISSDPEHKSKNLALLSSMYMGANVIEIFAQKYQNYTVQVYNVNDEPIVDQFRTDIRTYNFGINYHYSFNHRRFSFDAASLGTQVQKRSAGTPLVGGYLSYFNLTADSAILSSNYANSDAQITRANLFAGGISAGYAYFFVLPAHFYVMLSLTPKLGLNGGNIKSTEDKQIPISVSPGFLTRNAIGYSSKKFYGFLSALIDYDMGSTGSNNTFSYDPVKIKLLVGYRFD